MSPPNSLSYCPFDELPPEILSVIFALAPCAKTLGRLLRTCKRFYEWLKSEQKIWKDLCVGRWRDNNFHHKVSLEKVVSALQEFDSSKNWIWFAACFAAEEIDSGLSWKKFNTNSGRSLVSIGSMNNRKLSSIGVEVYLDGSTFYLGHFVEGKLHGKGSIFWEGGAKYEGDWNDGHREGWGSYTWANGDRYVGEFKNDGKKEGKGSFYYADGDLFEGQYCNDEREGWGRMIWKASQFTFEGMFVNNEPADPEASLHPSLRSMIQQQACTGLITGKSLDFGQFFYECECADYCSVCWNSCPHARHSGEGFKWVRRWSDGTYCACVDRDSCMRRQVQEGIEQPPVKRQKSD